MYSIEHGALSNMELFVKFGTSISSGFYFYDYFVKLETDNEKIVYKKFQ